jgi:hypothetical protein
MRGRSPIVLKIDQHRYYEHPTLESAEIEAQRLALKLNGECVVYVPVVSVIPPRGITTARLDLPPDLLSFYDFDLPF